MRSLINVILLFFLYWAGFSLVGIVPVFWECSIILSNHIGRYVFIIPFLYFLFRKTGIAVFSKEQENTVSPLFRLLAFGISLYVLACLNSFFFNPSSLMGENTELSVAEIIAINFSIVIMCPITEELFFRRWMISYLEKANVKPLYIICLTTLLFAIPHTDTTIWYFRFDTIIFGIVLYHVFVKYRDVRYCIFVHFVLNLTSTIVHIVSQYL